MWNNRKTCKKERGGDKKDGKKVDEKYLIGKERQQEQQIPGCSGKLVSRKVV